ncbi:MAG: hypothetical protein Kow0092_16820 [Deferrisomatales bacterium]
MRVRRILAVALAAAVPFLTYWGLKAPAVDRYLARNAPRWAGAVGLRLELRDLDFDPWGPSLSVTGLRLAREGGPWSLSAPSLRIRLRFWKSLAGTPHVDLEAQAPRLSARPVPRGEERPKGAGARRGGLPRVVFDTLQVAEGWAALAVPEREFAAVLPRVTADWRDGRGTVRLDGGELTWRGRAEAVDHLVFEGERRYAALRVDRLEAQTDRVRVEGSGKVGPWGLLDLDLGVAARLADLPAEWLRGLRLARYAPVEGRVQVRGHLGGAVEAPRFQGRLEAEEARFGPLRGQSLAAALEARRGELRFSEVSARTDAGVLEGARGRLSWGPEGLGLEADGRVRDYDLRRFMALFRREYFPVGLLASGTFHARGPLAPELALEGRVEARVRGLDVTTGPPERRVVRYALPEARVQAACTVGRQELELGPSRVEAPGAVVAVPSGRVEYRRGLWLDTELTLAGLDAARRYVPPELDARGRAVGRFGGPYRELTFDYDLDLDAVSVRGREVGRLRASARYDLWDLVLREGTLEGPLGRVRATGTVRLRPGGTYALEVVGEDLDAAGLVALAAGEKPAEAVEGLGRGRAEGRLAGPLGAPVFEGTAALGPGKLRGLPVEGVEGEGRASRDGWELHRGGLRALGGALRAAGSGDRRGLHLQGTVEGLDLGALAEALRPTPAEGGAAPVQGRLAGTVAAEGPYRAPRVEVAGRIAALVVAGRPLGDPEVSVRLEDAAVQGSLTGWGGAARVSARVGLSEGTPFRAEARLRGLPRGVLPWLPLPEGVTFDALTGRLEARGTLGGGPSLTAARWEGVAEGLRAVGLSVGRTELSGEYGQGALSAAAAAWEKAARLALLYSPEPGAPLEVELAVEGLPTARLAGWGPWPEGRLWARGAALLGLEEWRARSGLARLGALADLHLDGRLVPSATGSRPALPQWTFQVASPEGLPRVRLRSEGVEVDGTVDDLATARWRAAVHLRRFDLGRWLPPGHPAQGVEGRVSAELMVQGAYARPAVASGEGTVEGLAWGPLAPSRWTWSGSWDGRAAAFRAEEPRGVTVEGTWDPARALEGRAELREVPLEGWTREPLPFDLSGVATGAVTARLPRRGALEGEAAFSRLELSVRGSRLANRGEVLLGWRGGRVELRRVEFDVDGGRVAAVGSLSPGLDWDVEAVADLDLGALARWVPQVERASGTARGELALRGPWRAPQPSGTVEIRPGASVALEGLDTPLTDLDASAVLLGPEGVEIEWVDAAFGDGRVHGEGMVGLEGVRPSSLRLSAELRDVRYEAPPQVSYAFDADLVLTGTVARPEIRGEVRLEELRYARRVNWKTTLLRLLRRRPRQVSGATREGRVFVDVVLQGDEGIRVDNNLAQVSLAVDLRARGYLPDPTLWGRVEVRDGTVRFRSVEYEVADSRVEFLGESRPAPLLEVHGSTVVDDYAVRVDIVGPLDDYRVGLASVPPLPPGDIAALLTLGTTPEGMEKGESVTAAQAASFLTGGLQDQLESSFGEMLGIDMLEIDPAYSPAAQSTVPRVTLGKNLTRSLQTRYSVSVGGQVEQDAQLRYRVSPNLDLLGTWNDRGSETRGSLGGELRLRFTFR